VLTPEDYLWLFRRSPVMATLIGDDGRYLDVNDAFLGRLGYARSDMIGARPADFVTADSAARIETEFLPTLRRTGKLEKKPINFLTHDGDVVNCLTNSIVEYDPTGKFVRTLALYTEVSDQGRSDWKYRQLYRATPAMLHTVDAEACIVTVTDYWLQKMGYSREEVVGRSIRDFFSDADRKRFSSGKLREIVETGLRLLETAEAPAPTLVTPYVWSDDDGWKRRIFTKEQPFLEGEAYEHWIQAKEKYRQMKTEGKV